KSRNVDFCFVTWNIFTNGTAGKYGITDKAANPTTIDYFRKSVAQMFLTYPDLRGIGLTTGENMHRMSPKQKEDWAFATYGQGVLDAARAQPGRKIRFIHRQHMTDHEMIQKRFAPLIEHPDIDFIYSFKYAKAHCFSSVTQPYHRKFVQGIGKTKTIWTLRNDDVFHLRWGGPDFVRTFIRNIPYDVSQGFYYGSDNYIWGREFLSTEPDSPRQLEIDKHWYHWMIWGRLGYDPDLSNERFTQIIQTRFPKVDAKALFEAWQEASMIFPVTTGYHWGSIDIKWYIEGCRSHPKLTALKTGFHGVEAFITQAVHPSTDNVRIPDYVKAVAAGKKVDGTTPIAVAERLHGHADKALARVNDLRHSGNKELRLTLDDIRAMARLGKYYAYKIRGAAELALFRKIRKEARQARAVAELNHAAHHYRVYASLMVGMYRNPLWTNRDGYVDWRKQMAFVLDDVRTAGGAPALAPMAPTPGGAIHEAEDAKLSDRAVTATKMAAFTGKGYVDVSAGATLTWAVDATRSGTHVLELRYATDDVTLRPAKVLVNGKTTGDIILWSTGGTWGWNRKPATLRKGANSIAIAFAGAASVDHLNVIGTHDD
ncbi:carbohydrate-binding family 6 protein, partial [bacterium]|nr:carbohydrate-binding family 6 protein [bacterium]